MTPAAPATIPALAQGQARGQTRVALIQLNSGDDPEASLRDTLVHFHAAVAGGARLILTPEMTNCISSSREHQRRVFRREGDDPTLAALREAAAGAGVWLLVGSLGLIADEAEDGAGDGRFANRSFLIGPDGVIRARYDKIHMFDINVSRDEVYRESAAYRPGGRAVLADTDLGRIGMTVCYDLRFPHLFRRLAIAGAQILTVPAAFTQVTGAAHWHVLLRARAIESGAWVLAPAQTGFHAESHGPGRHTYGHSLVVSPWGEVVAEAGTDPGVTFAEIDLAAVARTRGRIPSLWHDRAITGP